MPQISYIRGSKRLIVDHENKIISVQDCLTLEVDELDYVSFMSVKDVLRDNDVPYTVKDLDGTEYTAIPFCAETEQDKINHRIFADSK